MSDVQKNVKLPTLPKGLRWAKIGRYGAAQAATMAVYVADWKAEGGDTAFGPAPLPGLDCCVLAPLAAQTDPPTSVMDRIAPAPAADGPAETFGGRPLVIHRGTVYGCVEAWRPSRFASETVLSVEGTYGFLTIERVEGACIRVRAHTPRAVVDGAREALVARGLRHTEVSILAAGEPVIPAINGTAPAHAARWRREGEGYVVRIDTTLTAGAY